MLNPKISGKISFICKDGTYYTVKQYRAAYEIKSSDGLFRTINRNFATAVTIAEHQVILKNIDFQYDKSLLINILK